MKAQLAAVVSLFVLLTFASAPPVLAFLPQPTITLVAAQGDAVGSNTLTLAGPPAIDASGDVAFHALLGKGKTANFGIVLASGTTLTFVADGQTADPVTGATFTKLSDPVLSGSGALAFVGTLKPGTGDATGQNKSAVYVFKNNTSSLVARTSGTAPGLGGPTFTAFSQIAVDDFGGVAMLAKVSNAKQSPALFGTDLSGNLQLLTNKGATFTLNGSQVAITSIAAFAPLPLIVGQTRTLDEPTGNIVAMLKGSGGKLGFFVAQPLSNGFNIGSNTNLAGVNKISEPAIDQFGDFEFSAVLGGIGVTKANNYAILQSISGTANLDYRTGNQAPDTSGTSTNAIFTKMSQPLLNENGSTAFVASLKVDAAAGVTKANDTGIWSDADGPLKEVVREGDPAPGSTGKFASFQQLVLPDVGGPIFVAKLSGVPATGNVGVWAKRTSGIMRVVITGDQLDVHGTLKTVKKFAIFQLAPMVMGQSRSFTASTGEIVFQATFTDGTWGIYTATLP